MGVTHNGRAQKRQMPTKPRCEVTIFVWISALGQGNKSLSRPVAMPSSTVTAHQCSAAQPPTVVNSWMSFCGCRNESARDDITTVVNQSMHEAPPDTVRSPVPMREISQQPVSKRNRAEPAGGSDLALHKPADWKKYKKYPKREMPLAKGWGYTPKSPLLKIGAQARDATLRADRPFKPSLDLRERG